MSDDTYQDIGYGAMEIGFGERPGILVVDLQTGFTQPRLSHGRLPACASRRGEHRTGARGRASGAGAGRQLLYRLSLRARHALLEDRAGAGELLRGRPCAEMEPRTSDPDYDYILQKSGPSIFFQTPVTAFLTKHGVDTTIVVGCMTSGCIRASVIDSFSYGYRTMVPEDCVGDADERPHRDNLRDVGRRYADIVSSERVLDYLDEIRKRNA